MPKKALASLNVVINAVTSPLFRGLNKASKRLTVFGAKMKAVGRSISMSFSLPFATISAAGAKMAIDFEKNMTKINTLVGISGKEVNRLSQDVMKLSGTTAQSPVELADGLFFLTSAGLRGANAMETLEAVSKGTAIGLGEQADLAKVAAAAQNAYGADTITAAQALDVFGGAVRQGMFEASDLAEVLGTQLGLASSLGVSFEETNAFIATYTKTTGDAKAASTSFGGVMMALAKTTPQMERALNKVGMSGDSVREMLGEQGLRSTLEHIKTAFENNNVPLTEFFSKSQALKGVLGVLGNQSETYADVLDSMHDSMGMVDDGFGTLEETTGFKMQKAFNSLKLASQELGAVMLPVFTQIVDGAVKLAKAFMDLDSGTKKIIGATGTLIALSGPLATLAGGLVSVIGMILSPIGLVVVALGVLFKVIYDNWGEVKRVFVNIINYFIDLYNHSSFVRKGVEGIIFGFKALWFSARLMFKNIWAVIKAFAANVISTFKGLAKVIEGTFTKNPLTIIEGVRQTAAGIQGTLEEAMEGVADNYVEYGEDLGKALEEGLGRIGTRDHIPLITEKDIQTGVDNIANWLEEKLGAVRKKMEGFMGGPSIIMPEGENDEVKNTEKTEDKKTEIIKTHIKKRKSFLRQYLDWSKDNWDSMAEKVGEVWNSIADVAQTVLNGIGNLWAAQHEKRMTILDNEEKKENEGLQKGYEREKAVIENSVMSEENKQKALLSLDEKYDGLQNDLDEKMDRKRANIQKKAAIRDKQMKIAQAIMATAQAVVQALTAGPIAGPILAGVVGALGVAQVAAIASTPIPLAKGGLAFGPTNAIVGDNPGAANDPEVIAPLSKLKQMLSNEMNIAVNVGGMLKGNDIYLSNENTTNQRLRYV